MNSQKLVSAVALFFASFMMFSSTANATTTVIVSEGDTVSSLSEKYGVSIEAIETANGIDSLTHLIFTNQELTIPSTEDITDHANNIKVDTILTSRNGAPAPKVAEKPVVKPEPVVVEAPEPEPVVVEAPEPEPVVVETPAPVVQQPVAQPVETVSSNVRTMTCSFYDPAVLGSGMGYGGVAANLSVYPMGTRLKIEMSDGQVLYRVVNDTGSFAAGNPNQLDIAMPNSQVPAAGILSARVTVVG